MRWLWVLLLAPSIALAGIGTVEHDEGRTWNERSNKTENIDVGYDVLMDDFFQTGEDGQIGIIFEDDTSVTVIENNTDLAIFSCLEEIVHEHIISNINIFSLIRPFIPGSALVVFYCTYTSKSYTRSK
jgi:hypothetical protein